MVSDGRKHASLAGKLLLSTALVAVSLAYGWWERHNGPSPGLGVPMPQPPVANNPAPTRNAMATPEPKEAVAPAANPVPDAGASIRDAAGQAPAAPARHQTAALVMPRAPAAAPSSPEAGLPQPDAAPPTLSALASLRMYQPPPPQMPLPPVTGTPSPGTVVAVAPGTWLKDGDYLSDIQQYEWGDLQVKISVQRGQIVGAQVVQYPDHRSESLQLSQMASPILDSEVIKAQTAKVDAVSSATDTSYAYQQAIASAIVKATSW